MILTDKNILQRIQNKSIQIEPKPNENQIQPASIDLRLSNDFLLPVLEQDIDIKNESVHYEQIISDAIRLPPKAFVLGSTIEKVKIPSDLIARVEGRSSIGRLGIAVHITAGFIDTGFEGQITLEIANLSQNHIILYKNMRICQIVFEELKETPNHLYGECGNKYQGQEGATGSLIYYDEDTNEFGDRKWESK